MCDRKVVLNTQRHTTNEDNCAVLTGTRYSIMSLVAAYLAYFGGVQAVALFHMMAAIQATCVCMRYSTVCCVRLRFDSYGASVRAAVIFCRGANVRPLVAATAAAAAAVAAAAAAL